MTLGNSTRGLFLVHKHYCYEIVPKKETISCTFVNLVENMQKYKKKKI